MADAENETHSGDLPVLQPLPPTHFVNEKACPSQKQQKQPELQTCLNNSFQLLADTIMSKFENLTSKIVEKSCSRAKAKEKRLRKGRQSDDVGKASSEPSSDSESELEEQVRQRKKKQKIKINSSKHADDDSKLAGNLNNILGSNKESEDEDSDSGLKSLIQELNKD